MAHECPDKKCFRCSVILSDDNWFPSKKKRGYKICKTCVYVINKPSGDKRRVEKKEQIKKCHHIYKHSIRTKARDILGGVCQLCGTDEDLHFGHIEYNFPDKKKSRSSYTNATEVIKFPNSFLLLCFQCHRNPEKYLKELIDIKSNKNGTRM